MIQSPLAYKFVTIMVLMAKVNYYAPRMHLPVDVPVKERDIRVLLPDYPILPECGGRLQVKNYSFTFDDNCTIVANLDQYGYKSFGVPMGPYESSNSGMERASRVKYVVSTNDIYRMATNWLEAADIDVQKLEKTRPPCVNKYPIFHSSRGEVPSPILVVDWSKGEGYDYGGVSVEISAVTGELLGLQDDRGDFNRNPKLLIKDKDKLAAIPDTEFLKYSTMERSNLLVQFAGLHCTNMYCPGVDSPMPGLGHGFPHPSTPLPELPDTSDVNTNGVGRGGAGK